MGKKRFGVLLCAQDSEYVKKMYGGYFGVFVKFLMEEGEAWEVFKVANGEFPEDEEIEEFDGFVITGSCSDAHGNEVWICKLLNLLKKLNSLKKKILGICFGHQILGRALGGKIGRSGSGWDIGVRSVNLSTSKFFNSLQLPSTLSVFEFHQDEIWELPPSVEVMAWSSKTRIEMFSYESHIMGIQGHPEYTKDILLNIMDRCLHRSLIQDEHTKIALKSIETNKPDREAWKQMCISFLKDKIVPVETMKDKIIPVEIPQEIMMRMTKM